MNDQLTIAIGCDHAGYPMKSTVIDVLQQLRCEVADFGTFGEESVDYPDHIHPVALSLQKGQADLGIILCGSGNGAAMTANKHQDIRAALCWSEELARLARQHNDANILSIPARFVSTTDVQGMVKAFLTERFEGGRHQRRVEKIKNLNLN